MWHVWGVCHDKVLEIASRKEKEKYEEKSSTAPHNSFHILKAIDLPRPRVGLNQPHRFPTFSSLGHVGFVAHQELTLDWEACQRAERA